MGTRARTPVSAAVYLTLRADILGGRLAVGAGIPSERTLSERFSVARHAVREAVRRLEQAGLVQVSHGGATRVRDWHHTGGLELLSDLPASGDRAAVRAGYELRACLAVEVAARAAQRAGDDHRARLRRSADALTEARARGDEPAVLAAYRALWDILVDASANIAYRLAYNSLLAAEATVPQLALDVLRAELEDADGSDALIAAVLDADPDGARAAAEALAGRTLRAVAPAAGARTR